MMRTGIQTSRQTGIELVALLLVCCLLSACREESSPSQIVVGPAPVVEHLPSADPASPPELPCKLRVLMLGNSHTGRVAETLRQLLNLPDPASRVDCEVLSGRFLDALAANPATRSQIVDGNWDVVLLQGQKISTSGKYYYPVDPAIKLAKLAHNSGARVLLFAEWGRPDVDNETERIRSTYEKIARQTNAEVVPVGDAWENALKQRPDLSLLARDRNHCNPVGAFLSASVLAGAITLAPPDQLPVLESSPIESKLQRFLHDCAAATLAETPWWPVSAGDPATNPASSGPRWYRGNLHTHSLWSDGDDFPEMITAWYVREGYHFLAMSDHNILARGDRWMAADKIEQRGGQECLDKYRAAFGETLMQTRQQNDRTMYRLTPLEEYRGLFERPGEFLLLEGEEVSDAVDGIPVHLNATNLQQLLQPVGGASVRQAIENNLRVAAEQASRSGQRIMMHINHPNYGWAVTGEDLAAVATARFMEVYNGHNSVNHLGDCDHPSVERLWDIANTLRIDKFKVPPLLGLATDDSHYYHGRPGSHPGRGWVMVRAAELTPDALLSAMAEGDFYASSGVALSAIEFDCQTGTLRLRIEMRDGETCHTQFIGTRRSYDQQAEPRDADVGQAQRLTRKYSADIGEVLASEAGPEPVYRLQGDELYVRAVVTSSRHHPDPSFEDQQQQAWTQPVGWQQPQSQER